MCPKCNQGQLYREDADLVCLQCGYRKVEEPMVQAPSQNGVDVHDVTTDSADYYEELVRGMRSTLDHLVNKERAAAETAQRCAEERKRLTKAIAFLTGKPAAKKADRVKPVCPDCGEHRLSKKHREQCKTPVEAAA